MIDPRRDIANAVAAQIVDLLAGDHPGGKAQLYERVLFLITEGMFLADEEAAARWKAPSNN